MVQFSIMTLTACVMVVVCGCVAASDNNDEYANQAEDESVASVTEPLTDGVYEVPSGIAPRGSYIVNEWLSSSIPAHTVDISWYFCGQAAMATAINQLRRTAVSDDTKITQLQWFHEMLEKHQTGYKEDERRQAHVVGLNRVMNLYKSDEFETQIGADGRAPGNREVAKNQMAAALTSGRYVIALGKTPDDRFGHYYVVHKIDFRATAPEGGQVYYSDVINGRFGQMGFSKFLDRMRAASSYNLYNFLTVKKR